MECTCLTCGRVENNQLLFWNKCLQCQRIEYLETQLTKEQEKTGKVQNALQLLVNNRMPVGVNKKDIHSTAMKRANHLDALENARKVLEEIK